MEIDFDLVRKGLGSTAYRGEKFHSNIKELAGRLGKLKNKYACFADIRLSDELESLVRQEQGVF